MAADEDPPFGELSDTDTMDPAAEPGFMSDEDDTPRSAADLEAIFDVPVRVSAVLGRAKMGVSELLRLEAGRLVELDRKVGEAVDIYVNDRLVARGEVVLVDERLGITMTEIVKNERG